MLDAKHRFETYSKDPLALRRVAALGLMLSSSGLLQFACGDSADSAKTNATSKNHAGDGSAGGSGASGLAGAPDLTSVVTSLQLMCDASIESVSSCGSTDCPELPPQASSACMVNCCTADGLCGTQITDARYGGALGCLPPLQAASPDPRCPTSMTLGITFDGCCDAQGHCGQLLGPACVSLGTGRACDAAADAGL